MHFRLISNFLERKNAKEKDRTKEKGRKDGGKTERHQVHFLIRYLYSNRIQFYHLINCHEFKINTDHLQVF